MVTNGARAIVVRNRLLRERKDEYAASTANECRMCGWPWAPGTEPPADHLCRDCARSVAS
ncbi:hypothetical protein G1H11_21835 [Phytoactinopolyspora alkaliphila]|uniref:Uncharacterized protein n=1 Tax=Phytoactinopolyspora alkaliphila TaxID=1783498 RepID=A0A6N9YSJ3_9ACTN|nr:hypothetical protein [Phytoactinopolyspora alkaliphila]NED97944.1 hypothetical protein [Phytoactinopolyspora alkaliphila]